MEHKMSNRLFQGVIHQLRDAIGKHIGIIDEAGTIISCSELGKIGDLVSAAADIFAGNDYTFAEGYTFRTFGSQVHSEYAVFIEGTDDDTKRFIDFACVALSNIKQLYDEKFDRGNFIKWEG